VAESAPTRRVAAGLWSDAWWRLRRDKVTMAAFAVLGILVVISYGAEILAVHVFQRAYTEQELLKAYHKPTLEPLYYMLGADEIGRSQVVRLLYGGQVSLSVAFLATAISLTIGVAIGLSAGYFRGWWDDLVTWFTTTLTSIPQLYLLLIFAGLFSPSPATLIFVLGILVWVGICLFVRGQTFALREREFVTAARTVGASEVRIMWRHILPNVLPLIFILAAIDAGSIILIESALSYLGLGITPPTASWGNMLTNAAQYFVRAWWLVVPPGVMIFLTVLALYLIGDGLRDALDPRLRGTH
jgi:peptide/nickel transport system permease protein